MDPAARAVPVPRRRRPRARRARRRGRHRGRRATGGTTTHRRRRRPPARRDSKVLDFTAFWAGPFATAWLAALGADVDQGRSDPATRRHPLQRRGASARRPAVLREVGPVPRGEPRQARHHARPRSSRTASRSRKRLVARCDVVVENFTPRVLEQFGLDYEHGARAPARHRDAAHARVRAHRSVARPAGLRADDGAAHRHGLGHRLRGRPADHPGRCRRSDGRHARRARAHRRARAPGPHRAKDSWSKSRSSRWRRR